MQPDAAWSPRPLPKAGSPDPSAMVAPTVGRSVPVRCVRGCLGQIIGQIGQIGQIADIRIIFNGLGWASICPSVCLSDLSAILGRESILGFSNPNDFALLNHLAQQ